jgi:DNA-directed RNA polymerase subunit RPC12/RpoP
VAEPVHFEERRSRSGTLAMGTFACPRCDAPVSPGPRGLSPAAWVACPYCDHATVARDFLSLTAPSRPARVRVTVR